MPRRDAVPRIPHIERPLHSVGTSQEAVLKLQGSVIKGFSDMTNRARSAGTRLSQRSLRLALWGLLATCGASAFAATGDGGLEDPNIAYVGRRDKSDSTLYRSYRGGAYTDTKFTGTTVKVKLASTTTFMAILDGTLTTYSNQRGTVRVSGR